MTANNGLTSTEVINVNNIIEPERPVLYVTPSGTLGSQTDKIVTFTLSTPNGGSDVVYYYNDGNGWVQLDGDTYSVLKTGEHKVKFKAVSGELESYESPEYTAILTTSYYKIVFKTTVLEAQGSTEEQRLFRVLRFMLTMNLSVQQMIAAKLSVFLKRANIIFFSITVHSTDVK